MVVLVKDGQAVIQDRDTVFWRRAYVRLSTNRDNLLSLLERVGFALKRSTMNQGDREYYAKLIDDCLASDAETKPEV